ncbi:MAG: Rne/Rng family ribonuclease [Hyphomicrobiaceae bacterium]
MDKNKMLIDATHPEETRVVAVRNGRVEEFDFESAARKLLRGNIYLAKVTRVEPSLQAAFIDYGGNRHGFLAFNEIHPDYYQIPVADRELLKQEEAEAEQRAEAEVEERVRSRGPRRRRKNRGDRSNANGNGQGTHHEAHDDHDQSNDIETFEDGYRTSGPTIDDDAEASPPSTSQPYRHESSEDDVLRAEPESVSSPQHEDTQSGHDVHSFHDAPAPTPGNDTAPPSSEEKPVADVAPPVEPVAQSGPTPPPIAYPRGMERPAEVPGTALSTAQVDDADVTSPVQDVDDDDESDDTDTPGSSAADDETVEQVAVEDDALEEVPERPRRRARQYKIQEVIKRRQIMLVQVVKEERGNKGAALTTYISLAGRYTVLMPNTARGGGISRKITQPQDRKRLKAIAEELDVPEGMGLIIRTAGAARTKQEIKRDYEYLLRLWESVRDLTLSSTAPCLVYEEGNIIKRAIRDLYSKDFDNIVVAGDSAHHDAQDFMEMLMPGSGSHVANYRAPEPLFARYGVERQLNALFSPYVTLRSGGYIVINQTEALVSVDVNSGKSTREFSIEETALNTNLEAAEEIARQLKLRDLAGLIVVDFIDMEEKRNNRSVERRLKDALRHDRARIQVGRISHFGLLEMSRQRLRAGVLEGSTSQCPHCQGTGIIRSIESVALAVLRGLEDQLLKQPSSLIATTTAEVALYILNHKRAYISEMERRHGVVIRVEASDRMQGANFGVERIATPAMAKPSARPAVSMEWGFDRDDEATDEVEDTTVEVSPDEVHEAASEGTSTRGEAASDEERRGRRRRRRRGRRDRDGETHEAASANGPNQPHDEFTAVEGDEQDAESAPNDDETSATQDAGAEETVEAAGNDQPDEAGGEPRRRGRRRGRRGGRSRRREGEGASEAVVSIDDTDRHEWGVAEYARPGAEQPLPVNESERSLNLVSSVEMEARTSRDGSSTQATIVESISRSSETSDFTFCSTEAVRLAVTLAGGTPEAPAEAPTASTTAEEEATHRLPDEPSVTPPDRIVEEPVAAEPGEMPEALEEKPAAESTNVVEPVAAAMGAAEAIDEISAPRPSEPAPAAEVPATTAEMPAPPAPEHSGAPERVAHSDDHNDHPAAPSPRRSNGHAEHDDEPLAAQTEQEPQHDHIAIAVATEAEPPRPARRGWWQRRFGGSE